MKFFTLQTRSKKNGANEESWTQAWDQLGQRVEARADQSLEKGHNISARESYLRAYTYYRAPLLFISPIDEIERYRKRYRKAQNCFQQAANLFSPPIERVEIPFENRFLPGYFAKVDQGNKPLKTLLMIEGGDTFAEDLYAYIVPACIK